MCSTLSATQAVRTLKRSRRLANVAAAAADSTTDSDHNRTSVVRRSPSGALNANMCGAGASGDTVGLRGGASTTNAVHTPPIEIAFMRAVLPLKDWISLAT